MFGEAQNSEPKLINKLGQAIRDYKEYGLACRRITNELVTYKSRDSQGPFYPDLGDPPQVTRPYVDWERVREVDLTNCPDRSVIWLNPAQLENPDIFSGHPASVYVFEVCDTKKSRYLRMWRTAGNLLSKENKGHGLFVKLSDFQTTLNPTPGDVSKISTDRPMVMPYFHERSGPNGYASPPAKEQTRVTTPGSIAIYRPNPFLS